MRQTREADAPNIERGYVRSPRERRDAAFGGQFMNILDVESSIGVDRLATWNEVCYAFSCASRDASDAFSDMPEFRDRGNNFSEDRMWFAIANTMPNSESN